MTQSRLDRHCLDCAVFICGRCHQPTESDLHYIGTVDSHPAELQACSCGFGRTERQRAIFAFEVRHLAREARQTWERWLTGPPKPFTCEPQLYCRMLQAVEHLSTQADAAEREP